MLTLREIVLIGCNEEKEPFTARYLLRKLINKRVVAEANPYTLNMYLSTFARDGLITRIDYGVYAAHGAGPTDVPARLMEIFQSGAPKYKYWLRHQLNSAWRAVFLPRLHWQDLSEALSVLEKEGCIEKHKKLAAWCLSAKNPNSTYISGTFLAVPSHTRN